MEQQSIQPLRTIYNAKRFIGRSLEEKQVQEYASDHSFKVVSINESVSNHSRVGFEIPSLPHTRIISPEQVGSDVLRHLLKVTSDFLGHNQVSKAVIAVPAKFDANQRKATGEAFSRAGLKVVRVIEEPTAAAVAYKLHKNSNIHHILVYDFGGGTLDVSLLFVSKGSVQVYATDGDETLGGSDFDLCLLHRLEKAVEEQTGQFPLAVDPRNVDKNLAVDVCSVARLHVAAERIKCALTSVDTVPYSCQLDGKVVKIDIEKEKDFEEGCNYLFDRAMAPVHRLLSDLSMSKEDIDEVVLVGGSTRIPKVKSLLKDYFGKEHLNDHIDPDITVAYGAASILQ
jgi:molecular chaperone DnaK (HSP70)